MTRRRTLLFRVAGVVVAVAAITLCGWALVDAWPTVSADLGRANWGWLGVGLLASAVGMLLLAVLWRQVLLVFDAPYPLRRVVSWYFAGELGKYIPGGIWTVVGRGELARRSGVRRSTAYATTVLSLALMCVGAAVACGVFAPFLVFDGGRFGAEMLLLVLIPVGVLFAQPAISGRLFALVGRISRGKVALSAPSFPRMLGLILAATPNWLFVGGAAVAVTAALGVGQEPARVATAAVLAWIIGFLFIPVPAGAGIRELLFVLVCGLPAGQAVAVAAIARLMLIVVDGVGGMVALVAVHKMADAPPNDG